MQDKFIDINTLEGDKLVVSLCCNYPFIKEVLPADYKHLDIIEISIDRMEGNKTIAPKTFQTIVHRIIDELNGHSEVILYYFCNISYDIPNFRESRGITAQEYRNRLFKSLFKRYSKSLPETWRDVEIEMSDPETGTTYYIHILIRESQIAVLEPLTQEIANNFNIIIAMKVQE
ncbi:MAG: hypothetical protein J6U71_07565 [Bacteroidales bacterium]|nr:hypothetical protein [Bacteroidales bacterium]